MAYKDKEKEKANKRVYYEANKEKIKAKNKVYRENNKEKIKAKNKTYHEANRERRNAYKKAWYQDHKEEVKAYNEANKEKVKANKRAYYEANKKKIKAEQKVYRENNREHLLVRVVKRKALKKQATLPTTDDELIKKFYRQSQKLFEETGEKCHVDHIIPIHIGGAHHQDNLRVITAKENIAKGYEYIPELGGVWANNNLARKTKKKLEIK